ncbi:neuronal acetylcholine receptor subunit alpha-5-like [Arapaima gigas]
MKARFLPVAALSSGRRETHLQKQNGTQTRGSEMEHRLFFSIFSKYNQYISPVENVSDPVIVHFEVSMSQLVKVALQMSCGGCSEVL